MYFYRSVKLYSMPQFGHLFKAINGLLKTYKVLLFLGIAFFSNTHINPLKAQDIDPVQSIRDLKDGYLLLRLPSSKAKIDTLQALVARSTDISNQKHLQKQLDQAIEERDTLVANYIRALRDVYHFSKVGYYFDYESRNGTSAHFYNVDGTLILKEELTSRPVFYMYFERTEESEIDALVIYNAQGKVIPPPFPNNFSRSGINFLFLKVSERSFPEWRMDKINKKLTKYWSEIVSREP